MCVCVGGGGGGVIFYNRMKFRANPFSLSKVIESSRRFSQKKRHTMKNVDLQPVKDVCVLSMKAQQLTSVFLSKAS